MGCSIELVVHAATGAMLSLGKIWWESADTVFLGTKALKLILWDEFLDVFDTQRFSTTLSNKKKMEFLSLQQ